MDEDLLVTELPHQLYRGDTPLHLAAADRIQSRALRDALAGWRRAPAYWPAER